MWRNWQHFWSRLGESKQAIWALLLIAVILRLPLLNGSFWLDEAAQALESGRPWSEQFQIKDDFQPPLMHLLTFASIHLGNLFNLAKTEWWLRLWPSFLPGILSIWLTYVLGKRLASPRVGFIAASLLASSSLHVFYSQELRPYSLAVLWSLASTVAVLPILQQQRLSRPQTTWRWICWAICSACGLYSTYVYPFFLLSQGLLLWLKSGQRQHFFISSLAIALAFLPWLPAFLGQLQAGQALRLSMPGWDRVVSLTQGKALFMVLLKFLFGLSDLEINFFYVALTLCIALTVGHFIWQNRHSFHLERLWKNSSPLTSLTLSVCLVGLPLVLAWFVSFWVPVLQPKRVLFLLPFIDLFFALLIAGQWQQMKRHGAAIFWALLLLINLQSLINYWTHPSLQRENWRSLVQTIEQRYTGTKTVVVFAFSGPFAPWSFYQQQNLSTLSTGSYDLSKSIDIANQTKELAKYDNVLLFDYLRDLTDPKDQLPTLIQNLGFTSSGVIDYPNIGFVRLYSQAGKNVAWLMEAKTGNAE